MAVLDAAPSRAIDGLRSAGLRPTGGDCFRPVQFLGTKTRVLPALLEVAEAEIGGHGRVCDIFSGSSVVAQGLARVGHSVTAFDALEHCAHFARLGVGRAFEERLPDARELPVTEAPWIPAWQPWLEAEDAAAAAADGRRLIELAGKIPQIWRRSGASAALDRVFADLQAGTVAAGALVAAHYAGTYFGIRQAVEIDLVRQQVAAARNVGALSQWQESAMLTALLSAASECPFVTPRVDLAD
jgi:adenine-specific DNA-methyltransferase